MGENLIDDDSVASVTRRRWSSGGQSGSERRT
jgi:hypothetical protein